MADPSDDKIILKILSGLQAGVEVLLASGDYSIGTGVDDDIQFVDVSMRPGHAKLKLGGGKIMLAGGSGPLRTKNGLTLEPGGALQDIEPLDVVTAGTARFALGRPSAQWSTLADDQADDTRPAGAGAAASRKSSLGQRSLFLRLLAPVAGFLAVFIAIGAYLVYGDPSQVATAKPDRRPDLERVAEAVGALSFTDRVKITTEADGRIIVSGHVDTLAERRAVIQAIESTAAPAFPRIWVIDGIESEVRSYIESSGLPVTFALARDGRLDLAGTVLDAAKVDALVTLLRQDVSGLVDVASKIRTAKDFLADVQDLASRAGVGNEVVFRLDGQLIEANGAVPADKVDAWVGFMQSYSRRFADAIALRSYVTLQGVILAGGDLRPVVLGPKGTDGAADKGAIRLDADQLKDGRLARDELFAAPTSGGAPVRVIGEAGQAVAAEDPAPVTTVSDAAAKVASPEIVAPSPVKVAATLQESAQSALQDWRDGKSADGVAAAITAVAQARAIPAAELADSYLALFRDPRQPTDAIKVCQREGAVNENNLPAILFWLDLISSSSSISLESFEINQQQLILEAALNPSITRKCQAKLGNLGPAKRSLYLEETLRNPDFVRYVTRSLPIYNLDVAGAKLAGSRFVQTVAGERLVEGAAPIAQARIAIIGELGMAIQKPSRFEVVIYGSSLAWRIGP